MVLKVKNLMDCKVTLCSSKDTVDNVTSKLVLDKSLIAVALDDNLKYLGIIHAYDLFYAKQSEGVLKFVKKIDSVDENALISDLSRSQSDYIPVVNSLSHVVGLLNLSCVVDVLGRSPARGDSQKFAQGKNSNLVTRYTITDIVGQSKAIISLKEQIISAAKTKSTVLIIGETGTGKELVSHAIHRLSNRRHNPFVRINCATIPDTLLESELFGYESGAFTDASRSGKLGKFEQADKGTFFLDEIGDMPFSLQSKILRVLQEKEIEKIGGKGPISVDVRIVAATHRDLRQLVENNLFRNDLYYRLNVVPITIPPLRNHREDIPLLVEYLLEKHAVEHGVAKPSVDREFLTALIEHDWPGNVRELSNFLEYAVNICNGSLSFDSFPEGEIQQRFGIRTQLSTKPSLRNFAEDAEREGIIKTLEIYKGNKIKVCDALGISRSSLYNKLKKYSIEL